MLLSKFSALLVSVLPFLNSLAMPSWNPPIWKNSKHLWNKVLQLLLALYVKLPQLLVCFLSKFWDFVWAKPTYLLLWLSLLSRNGQNLSVLALFLVPFYSSKFLKSLVDQWTLLFHPYNSLKAADQSNFRQNCRLSYCSFKPDTSKRDSTLGATHFQVQSSNPRPWSAL